MRTHVVLGPAQMEGDSSQAPLEVFLHRELAERFLGRGIIAAIEAYLPELADKGTVSLMFRRGSDADRGFASLAIDNPGSVRKSWEWWVVGCETTPEGIEL